MAIVVLSHGAPASLADAVRSAQTQRPPAHVLVVNSGGGSAARVLADAGLAATIIDRPDRQMPGGARNLGIAATNARYLAFLADDCLAEPGWVAARLAVHTSGAAAVASALVCDRPNHPVALASHVSLFVRRMPAMPPADAVAYGASYDRRLFEVHGLFREDLRTGEDTEFHQRLAPCDRPVWAPSVRTVHRSPTRIRTFLADQYRRGRRAAHAWQTIDGPTPMRAARAAVHRLRLVRRLAPRVVDREHRLSLTFAAPLIVIGAWTYALGAWAAIRAASAARG